MTNLDLQDYRFTIDSTGAGDFQWCIAFFFAATGMYYSASAKAASPTQCFDAAMAFMSEKVREAISEAN